jgi:predicted benzoate:H+ symporter BenE
VLHLDIPSAEQFRALAAHRGDAAVTIALPTTPLSQEAGAMRTAFANLAREAAGQAEAAIVTFVVSASGVSIAGIGEAFWGLLAGGAVRGP